MADAVTSQTWFDGQRAAIMAFTNTSDGTGEAAVLKVNVAALVPACQKVNLTRIHYDCFGMSVALLSDATADVPIVVLQGFGCHDFSGFGGAPNKGGAGRTGNILFTTNGASAGDTYSIVLEMVKDFDG